MRACPELTHPRQQRQIRKASGEREGGADQRAHGVRCHALMRLLEGGQVHISK